MRTDVVQKCSKSIRICSVLKSTITVLRNNNENRICLCSNGEPHEIEVIAVDRFGFITDVYCHGFEKKLTFAAFEESYIVQMLRHAPPNQDDVIKQAFNGDHLEHIREVCQLLRRHSFYENKICPEYDDDDPESCRVTAIDKETGKVEEMEFVAPCYSQSIRINCRSDCYYDKYTSPSQYEETYKERMRENLAAAARWCQARGRTNETRSDKAILSCTVLAANSAIARRHNVDNKLCPYCDNDDQKHLQVVETDQVGFITQMLCAKCGRHLPTVCRRSRFYYEEIDESTFLKRGDHICWHLNLGYWHHAIVTSNHTPTVTIAEYGPYGRNVTFKETIKGGPDLIPSCLSGTPYRITYDDCYSNEYTALRAEKCIGEHHYNIFHRNCEHSSHWCKTGLNKSDQVVT